MKINIILTLVLFLIPFFNKEIAAQNTIEALSSSVSKGSYAVLEIRLNMEDEFRTVEGRDNEGLSRIALFTGTNLDKEILNKGFLGFNDVVVYLNKMKKAGWILIETYSFKGDSLIITHYVFEKKK